VTELTAGTWNTHNSFGDERAPDALEVVKRMDADVLYLGEMTLRDQVDNDYSLSAQDQMRALGYETSLVTNYSPDPNVRDMHTMSLWSRVGGTMQRRVFGQRYGTEVILPDGRRVHGLHLPDENEADRQMAADAAVEDVAEVKMGDFNAMYRSDPRSRLPRALGRVVGNFEVADYYDSSAKLQRLAGRILRVSRMADGGTMQRFTDAGFRDADPNFTPTVGRGKLAFQIDHILVRTGATTKDFMIHPQNSRIDGKPLSDHVPLTTRIR
jgi:endonuclease/exonuclease/phosphatase family metal-dependent hydrolase